ncbi:hypothetical protein [Falsiroseomonas sp.]|uniref:hypothetical protein n=1 Tax=Falsiroseomonas sp. TaxID=2870721 RepID=UPI003566E084
MIIGVFVAIGYGAHETGTRLARLDVQRLERDLAEVAQQRAALQEQNARLRAELDDAQAANRHLQQRYDAEVPRGGAADVMAAARVRLAAGLDAVRLRQVIENAEQLRRCDGAGISRRFRIGVGSRATEEDSTSFAEGMIRVSALVPVVSDNLAGTTTVTFSGLGSGGERSATGLPAEHLFVLDNRALRLRVTESTVRGFATATLTTCRPE